MIAKHAEKGENDFLKSFSPKTNAPSIPPFDCDNNLLELTLFESNGLISYIRVAHNGCVLCTFIAMFSQFDHPIILKCQQHQYVIILFNHNDQDSNMNFTKSSGLGTI